MKEQFYTCPYCFSNVSILIDTSIADQEYLEDCERCCNPTEFRISVVNGEVQSFQASSMEQ